MSKTMAIGPIVGALVKSEDILGKDREWNAVNDIQAHFLKDFFSKRKELTKFSEKELRSWASLVAAKLNKILEQEGFDIRLDKFKEDEFGTVSILDVMVEWLTKGEKTQVQVEGKDYPVVRMENIAEDIAEVEGRTEALFQVYNSLRHPHLIVCLQTKSGDKVYMTIADRAYQDFDLVSRIDAIRSDLQLAGHYDYLVFPMVDLNQEENISWLKQMWTIDKSSSQKAYISQALQQTKFKMNETGARVKSAVAIGITVVSIHVPKGVIIDKPFFLWIEREGMSIPLIYAYIDQKDWKNPGNLGM